MQIAAVNNKTTRFGAIVVPTKSTEDRLAAIFLDKLKEIVRPNSKLIGPRGQPDQYYNFYQDEHRKLPMFARIYWPKDGVCRIIPWPNNTPATYYAIKLADGLIKKENSAGDDLGRVEQSDKNKVQGAILNSFKAYKRGWFS